MGHSGTCQERHGCDHQERSTKASLCGGHGGMTRKVWMEEITRLIWLLEGDFRRGEDADEEAKHASMVSTSTSLGQWVHL